MFCKTNSDLKFIMYNITGKEGKLDPITYHEGTDGGGRGGRSRGIALLSP
jgi:hypothetical protein